MVKELFKRLEVKLLLTKTFCSFTAQTINYGYKVDNKNLRNAMIVVTCDIKFHELVLCPDIENS